MPVENRLAATDNTHTPSTSGTHLPAPVGLPDESPPREPATAPGHRGAQLARLGDRIAELSARIQAATHELLSSSVSSTSRTAGTVASRARSG